MRAREFVINVPITIKINGDGDPELDMGQGNSNAPVDPSIPKEEPVMVPPLQQQIELQKAGQGKNSPIIQDLTQDELDPDTKEPASTNF
jgi:hypothetical protein